jgi:hypothetical protein
MFSSYEKNQDPQRAITFGDGNQGLVKGLGKIAISPDHSISNVFLVDSLDYNLLFVSQLCKMGYNCLFTDICVTVFRRIDDSVAFKGVLEGQLYLVDFNRAELNTCLIAKTNMGWLWHRRLAHVGMKNLHKLLKEEHILGLTNVHFEKDRICSTCQAGKQVGVHHPHKNIMTTDRPLELCRRFDPGGSLDRRVNCRRVSQPRWVSARRSTKGGNKETGVKGKLAAFVFVLRPGRVRLQ